MEKIVIIIVEENMKSKLLIFCFLVCFAIFIFVGCDNLNEEPKNINDKTTENRDKVLGELGIDREFLGFKYWIIKDNNVEEFYDDIVWNKR